MASIPPPPPLTPATLAQAPELAVITLLDETLHLALLALAAEHPTLDRGDHKNDRSRAPPTLLLANRIVDRVQTLHRLLGRYQLAVADALGASDDSPFDADFDF